MFTRDPVGDKRIVEVQDFDELLKEANNVAGKICLGITDLYDVNMFLKKSVLLNNVE